MKEFYTIEDLAAMSGLTTRTLRSYLSNGQLEGEKVNGAWRFTAEQFERFLSQDMVRQSVQAKSYGRIYDFLLVNRRKEGAACLVWDRPVEAGEAEAHLRERLMEKVNALGVGCAYRHENGMARAILTGPSAALAELMTCLA